MKTVFDNGQCAHVWAQQNQDHGHSNSMKFAGPRIYSYSTCMAMIHGDLVLLNERRYSITTSGKHMPAIRSAITHLESVYVPQVDPQSKEDHATNMAFLREQYTAACERFIRMRYDPIGVYDQLKRLADNIELYARHFKMRSKIPDFAADQSAVFDSRAKVHTPEQRAKRAKAQAAAKKRKDAKYAARLQKFRDGHPMQGSFTDADGYAYLRARGDWVQTSQGASVPIGEARQMIPVLRVMRGNETEPSGLRIGAFTIRKIYSNGDIIAGCHNIRGAEIDALGATLGVAGCAA